MSKKISNLWLQCRIFIWLSYILVVVLAFKIRLYRFRFWNFRNKSNKRKLSGKRKYKQLGKLFKIIYRVFECYLALLKRFISCVNKDISMNSANCNNIPIGGVFFTIIGIAWFYEKLHINISLSIQNILFEHAVLISRRKHQSNNIHPPRNLKGIALYDYFSKSSISSAYGNKVISKMVIKKALQCQANEWADSNLRGDWIGVHYRGTDANYTVKYRYMSITKYIAYLKGVLGDHCNIFVCSDQAQFIEQVHIAFPGRVCSRDITRSDDKTPLHRGSKYAGAQQQEDALIDLLVLAKAKLVYTTGSYFVDVVRFLNPAIKIVSLDGREVCYKGIDNYLSSRKLLSAKNSM